MKFRFPHPGTDESAMVFSRRCDHIVPRTHPPGEAILLNRPRLSSSRNGSARSAASVVLGAAALAGVLATAVASAASTPGEPVSLLAPATPVPAETASAPVAAPVTPLATSPIRTRIDSAAELQIGGE